MPGVWGTDPWLKFLWTFSFAAILASLVMTAMIVERHVRWTRDRKVRARIAARLEPVVLGLLVSEEPEELHALLGGLNRSERPVAAALVIEIAEEAAPAQRERLRRVLEQSGALAVAERGTRRRSPWRRALACETLGKIGTARSVPALVARLDDRREEVRSAAVRALGDLGAAEAASHLSAAFLNRRCAPTAMMNEALRRLGPAGADAFDRGSRSEDSGIRVSSCYGLAAFGERDRLAEVLGSDTDAAVRTAASAALGTVGGTTAPVALVTATEDEDVRVRRAAVRALGGFDDAAPVDRIVAMAEDVDRETALRAAEALLTLSRREIAGPAARTRVAGSSTWSIDYVRALAEVAM